MSFKSLKFLFSILVIIFPGIIYLTTSAPTVLFIDSGELAVICHTLGIAHPTGYPIYTIVGRVFSFLPLKDVIFRLNLLSSLLVCFTNLFLFLTLLLLGEKINRIKNKNLNLWGSLVGTLIFAFTPTLWSQATTNEVYSLAIFFSSVIIYLAILWKKNKNRKILYLLIFLYGLSFGNHMSTILLLPGLIFLLISEKDEMFNLKIIFQLLLFLLLGISVYFYLPIRAEQNPILNWGNPTSWDNFFRHISGWQYQVWMFSESFQQLKNSFLSFLKLFYCQFPFHLLIFVAFGLFLLIKQNSKILWFSLIIFFSNLFYGINYKIPDIEPYFLPSFLITSIWIGCGIFFLFKLCEKVKIFATKKFISSFLIFVFFIFPLLNIAKNYFEQDRSKNFFAYDYAKNILRSVKKDAIILTNIWDHYSPWLYLRYVENLRPDVKFIDVRLAIRSWHFDYLKNAYPNLFALSKEEIEEFEKQVFLFEHQMPFNPNEIEQRYVGMFRSIITKNYETYPIYYDLMVNKEVRNIDLWVSKNLAKIPEGTIFRLKKLVDFYPYDFPELELRGVTDENVYKDERVQVNLSLYSTMIKNRISYLEYFGKKTEAKNLEKTYEELLSQKRF